MSEAKVKCNCDHTSCDDCNPGLSHVEFRASRMDAWKCAAKALKESGVSHEPTDVLFLARYLEGIGEGSDGDE